MISITREEPKLTKLTIHTEHKGKTDCIYISAFLAIILYS